jgi:hypothetical protein
MRKLLAAVLVFVSVAILSACSTSPETDAGYTPPDPSTSIPAPAEPEMPWPTVKQSLVGSLLSYCNSLDSWSSVEGSWNVITPEALSDGSYHLEAYVGQGNIGLSTLASDGKVLIRPFNALGEDALAAWGCPPEIEATFDDVWNMTGE